MSPKHRFLSPSEAAKRLGVSAKALRLYEERGFLTPARNPVGWRSYGPDEMARSAEVVALRALGLSLAQISRVFQGDAEGLEPALAAHQASLEGRARQLAETIEKVRGLRADLHRGQAPTVNALTQLLAPAGQPDIPIELPWPWGGELFRLPAPRPLNYIVGPLGSGKTRLAMHLAEVIPGAVFLGLERLDTGVPPALLEDNPALRLRVEQALQWLLEDGATKSDALLTLLASLEAEGPSVLVVDMVEQGLDQASQQALIAHLRRRGASGRPLYLMTRSSVILDLSAVGADELILFCPANHSPPMTVRPYPGAAGYEAVATCLATPEVRARTQGMVAWRPESA